MSSGKETSAPVTGSGPSAPAGGSGPSAPTVPAWARAAVEHLRAAGHVTDETGLTLRLARTYGFCQGVERAVSRALAAAAQLEARPAAGARPRLFLTGEIIHNPSTNERLRRAGVTILPAGDNARLRDVRPADWVIVPAFGSTLADAAELERIGCRTIDTTCGWVQRTWRTVARFAAEGRTTIIHGKVEHEETRATASRARGPYVIVRNRCEAELLARALRHEDLPLHPSAPAAAGDTDLAGRDRGTAAWPGWFEEAFAGRCSPGFDPRRDLERLGLVNQTTMLSSETQAIAAILAEAVPARAGRSAVGAEQAPLCTEDTFCPATQERQDAVRALLTDGPPDALVVVGGFRSSNTAHLAALGAEHTPTYHVEDAAGLTAGDAIRHLPPGATVPCITADWRPPAPCTIAVTAGASTPDAEIDRVLLRLLYLYREAAR